MSSLLESILENIDDSVCSEIMSIDEIIASFPSLTLNSPLTYQLYLHYNKGLPEKEVKTTHAIIQKLLKIEHSVAKKNLAYLEKDREPTVPL